MISLKKLKFAVILSLFLDSFVFIYWFFIWGQNIHLIVSMVPIMGFQVMLFYYLFSFEDNCQVKVVEKIVYRDIFMDKKKVLKYRLALVVTFLLLFCLCAGLFIQVSSLRRTNMELGHVLFTQKDYFVGICGIDYNAYVKEQEQKIISDALNDLAKEYNGNPVPFKIERTQDLLDKIADYNA